MRKVYQFGLRPPIEGEALIRASLRGAHNYRNDLVAIERGRRSVLLAIDDTPDVEEAIATVKASTRSTRKAAITALRQARKKAREASAEELARIDALDKEAGKGAYELATCAWGTRLDIASANQQARAVPLYSKDDAITPNLPKFVRGPRTPFAPDDPRSIWWLHQRQLAVQIQGGLSTAEVLRGDDTRVRIVLSPEVRRQGKRSGILWLRIGSEGRDPVWAKWPILMHRAVPNAAQWKWVRVSLRGEATREHWNVEISIADTKDNPIPNAHELDRNLRGAVAVEWEWSLLDDGRIRVARWADTRGESGEVFLPAFIASGIRKPDGIRAVRDIVLNETLPKIASAIKRSRDPLPVWLREAGNTLHLWKSQERLRDLARRWRLEKCDAAREAYEILDAWEGTEMHLYDYECSSRRQALGMRKHFYRNLAAKMSREYKTILLSDQDLSREAKFGPESDVRFTAAIYELRGVLRNAFGENDSVDTRWKIPKENEEDESLWCERVRDAWTAGGARGDGIFAALKEKTTNAWAKRKEKKKTATAILPGARKPDGNDA